MALAEALFVSDIASVPPARDGRTTRGADANECESGLHQKRQMMPPRMR
jgi:hypothetical protein